MMKIELGSLFGIFYRDKMKIYIEPQRQGTPWGQRIGLSRIKYSASIFSLMDFRGKDVAAFLNITHALYRKWKVEDFFNEVVDQHLMEFLQIVKNFLTQNVSKERLEYLELVDAEHYESDLKIGLLGWATEQQDNTYILQIVFEKMAGEERLKRYNKKMAMLVTQHINAKIQKTRLTKSDREFILMGTDFISTTLAS